MMWLSKCSTTKEYVFWKDKPLPIISKHPEGLSVFYIDNNHNKMAGGFYNLPLLFPLLSINAEAGYYEITIEELPSKDGYIIKRI